MNNIDYLQINKLSSLHNGQNIFFCKTDFIFQDFATITTLDHDVVLISGNSDYAITDEIAKRMPQNIKYWYAQNAITNHPKVKPMPIGIENKYDAKRSGHGISYYDRVSEKENIFNAINTINIKPDKFIYANFNVNTNVRYRSIIKDVAQNVEHIDWQEPNLDLYSLFNKFLHYKMILCPIGNGIDTHRIWETLYCNRIPITIKVGDYQIYKLYELFPIIVLDSIDDLYNKSLIDHKYKLILEKKYNKSLLSCIYWINNIIISMNCQSYCIS